MMQESDHVEENPQLTDSVAVNQASNVTTIPMYQTTGANSMFAPLPPPPTVNFVSPDPTPVEPTTQNPSQIPLNLPPIPSSLLPPGVSIPQVSTQSDTSQSLNPDAAPLFYPTNFSPAIPQTKGALLGGTTLSSSPPANISTIPEATYEVQGPGLFGWVKDAVSGNNFISRFAETAKNTVITTLDPQMREIVYSGGDVKVVVASDKEIKVSPVREAFQMVFGKATIAGVPAQSTNIAIQPVGFEAGLAAAHERISSVQSQQFPIVAVENFVVEVTKNSWFDVGAIVLRDLSNDITLEVFTQMTPVPPQIVTLAINETPSDYPHRGTGLSVPIGGILANNLMVSHTEWHECLIGIPRRELILSAAKAIAFMYKNSLEAKK